MSDVDPNLDCVVVPDGKCPYCLTNDAGPQKHSGACKECVKKLGAESSKPADYSDEARRELAERELARRRLLPFVQRLIPTYQAGWFHRDLAARLERFSNRAINGEGPRLIISCPPRHGKTELASKALLAWHLGRHPDQRIISAAHSDRLATDNSRDIIRYIQDERYRMLFPGVQLDKDNKGAMGWRTEQGGIYKPAGVGAGIAGYGANILVIDDPHRDKDAYSQAVRDSVWQWYKSSARTRLLPGGAICLIQTRWVLDDLTGRVIDEEGLVEEGGAWEHVSYPAVAEKDEYRLPSGRIIHWAHPKATLLRREGELLHPERYGWDQLAEAKQDPVVWQALYQQNPTAGDAAQFSEEMLEQCACRMADIPSDGTAYTAWDTAQHIKERNDFNVAITAKIDRENTLWVVDLFRERLEADDLIEAILDNYVQFRQDLVGIEKTQYVVGLQSSIERRMEERRLPGFPYEMLEHGNKDKVQRSKPIQSWMRRGRVRIPVDAPWYEALKKELLEFPGGRHDDQCVAEGTFVVTPRGSFPIESIRPGDEVLTPFGARRVKAAACTGFEFVYRLTTDTGKVLIATANHPVSSPNRGFVRMDEIGYMGQIQCARQSLLMGMSGTGNDAVQSENVRSFERLESPQRVYNLTVEDAHVYFANGVLTHNCDALAYLGQMLNEMTEPYQGPSEPRKTSWRDKVAPTGKRSWKTA